MAPSENEFDTPAAEGMGRRGGWSTQGRVTTKILGLTGMKSDLGSATC